jgi:putative porin
MLTKKITLRAAGASLAALISLAVQPLRAQTTSSESKEIEELKREVAELRQEVNTLKKRPAPEPVVAGEGKTKTEITYDGKTYVEKSVPIEKSAADKWKLSTSITEMELYGDVRLRYQYNGGRTDNTPVAAPGAGVAGTHDWQERERERYRLRLGLRGTLLDDWFFGLRLETNASARSTNVTFGGDTSGASPGGGGPFAKGDDTVYVGQAYGGYKGFPGFTFTAGRMPNPLVTTLMVWDPDINPEGLAEQWKHTFTIGGGAAPPPSYGKDGKTVVPPAPSEPFLKIDVFANFAQFVYDDSNPENPLGARSTTTANGGTQKVPNSDAFLLAWQVGARFDFPKKVYFQLAPTVYNYTGNGDTFNVHYQGGDPTLTNAASLAQNQTGINSLLVFDVPAEIGWKIGGLPMRIFGDFAVNLEGDDRASAAGHPGKGDQRYAYQAGLGVGQLKAKHDWQIDVWYQHEEQYSLDPNLIDDDITQGQLNMHGVAARAAFNLSAAVNLSLTYSYMWRYDKGLGTGGVPQAISINPLDQYQFFVADLNFKF